MDEEISLEEWDNTQQQHEAEVQQWQQFEEDAKMVTRKDFMNDLVKENNLADEDIFYLPLGGKKVPIITRTGIEKIQYHNNITVTFDLAYFPELGAVIKATAKIAAIPGRMKGDVSVESYGEASPKNTTQKYPVAMAEKRALSRAVLKISGFYKHGAYAEDEAENFKKPPSSSDDIRGPDVIEGKPYLKGSTH